MNILLLREIERETMEIIIFKINYPKLKSLMFEIKMRIGDFITRYIRF